MKDTIPMKTKRNDDYTITFDGYDKSNYKGDPIKKKVIYIKKGSKLKKGQVRLPKMPKEDDPNYWSKMKKIEEILNSEPKEKTNNKNKNTQLKKIDKQYIKSIMPKFKNAGKLGAGAKAFYSEFNIGKDKYQVEFTDYGDDKAEGKYIIKNGKDLLEDSAWEHRWMQKPKEVDKIIEKAMNEKIDEFYTKNKNRRMDKENGKPTMSIEEKYRQDYLNFIDQGDTIGDDIAKMSNKERAESYQLLSDEFDRLMARSGYLDSREEEKLKNAFSNIQYAFKKGIYRNRR